MGMYADYLHERTEDQIIEGATGFVTYRYLGKTVYIVDLYVIPSERKKHVASALADMVVREAKEKGCNELIGTVQPSAKNSTASMRVLLGYGMSLKSSGVDFIIFSKEI